ncbi:MAG: DinB family protein, partial [Cyclobacteriaceae bacterium]
MKKLIVSIVVCLPLIVHAQSDFQKDLANMIKMNSDKVISLAEAIPADHYNWSPAEGVRDVEGVVMHIIGANYFFPTMAGAKIPEGIDPRNMANTVKGKEASIKALKDSYTFLMSAIADVPDDKLNEEIDFFGTKVTIRGALMLAFGHCEEHMGQLIAYARSND